MLFTKEKRCEVNAPVSVMSLPQNGSPPPNAEVSRFFYPGIGHNERESSRRNGHDGHDVFLIVHRMGPGEVNLHSFEEAMAAQTFIERLLTDGVSTDAIHCYRASSLNLAVSFRPVVQLEGM